MRIFLLCELSMCHCVCTGTDIFTVSKLNPYILWKIDIATVVPLYVATLHRGHPFYKATILENKPCILVSDIPLTRGHPSNKARFSIHKGGLIRRGTLYYISYSDNRYILTILC